jgi:hypothetical protein
MSLVLGEAPAWGGEVEQGGLSMEQRCGDSPKPSIAAGGSGRRCHMAGATGRRLAWAQTEGVVEDVEPSDGSH